MPKDPQIFLVLHNIRSAYNVGSIFRTADGAGVSKIYLCGYTPAPNKNLKILKTALGAEKSVPWEYHSQAWRLLKRFKKEGVEIVSLEQTKDAIDYKKHRPRLPLALVVGNEVKGLSKGTLKYADKSIQIPMSGKKESLNVAVALGIAVYNLNKYR